MGALLFLTWSWPQWPAAAQHRDVQVMALLTPARPAFHKAPLWRVSAPFQAHISTVRPVGGSNHIPAQTNRMAALMPLCFAYLLGIVATELIVFDYGHPMAAYCFYTASLPSLILWPQMLRVVLPIVLIVVSLLYSIGTSLFPKQRPGRLRWSLVVAALLAFPGLLSFVSAIVAVREFCDGWSYPFRLHRGVAVRHLIEVQSWHCLMLLTLICCILAQRRAEMH